MKTPDRTKCMHRVHRGPCDEPAECQQVGSGIPLCGLHGAFLRKHGAKTEALPAKMSLPRPFQPE